MKIINIYLFNILFFIFILQVNSIQQPYLLRDDILWKSCDNLEILGETCLELYTIPSNLTIGVRLIIRNKIFLDYPFEANRLCLTDANLLQLLSFTPALVPFKPIIDAIVLVEKIIPANIYSVCAVVYNLNLNSTTLTGCTLVDATLMCLGDSCLAKYRHPFGCFTIPIKNGKEFLITHKSLHYDQIQL